MRTGRGRRIGRGRRKRREGSENGGGHRNGRDEKRAPRRGEPSFTLCAGQRRFVYLPKISNSAIRITRLSATVSASLVLQ